MRWLDKNHKVENSGLQFSPMLIHSLQPLTFWQGYVSFYELVLIAISDSDKRFLAFPDPCLTREGFNFPIYRVVKWSSHPRVQYPDQQHHYYLVHTGRFFKIFFIIYKYIKENFHLKIFNTYINRIGPKIEPKALDFSMKTRLKFWIVRVQRIKHKVEWSS